MMVRSAAVVTLGCSLAIAAGLAVPAVAAAAPGNDAKLTAALHDLGMRVMQTIHARSPLHVGKAALPALDACQRPSASGQAALTAQVTQTLKLRHAPISLAFGCMSAAGIIVDVHHDDGGRFQAEVWNVVRVRDHELTSIAEGRGVTSDQSSEWSTKLAIYTLALVDVDGDGVQDAFIATNVHTVGGRRNDISLALWSSKTGALRKLGALPGDDVSLAISQPRDGRPLIVQLHTYGDRAGQDTYRCLLPTGALTLCPEVEAAARADRAFAIARNFASDHPGYSVPAELVQTTVPDREGLAEQLTALAAYGVTSGERDRLLALAAPASPPWTITREVVHALQIHAPRKLGEPFAPADPRLAQVMTMLGDAPCSEVADAARKAMTTRLKPWLVAHDRGALDRRGECTVGEACRWQELDSPPAITRSCAGEGQAYYVATWRYLEPKHGDPRNSLVRVGVFHDRAGSLHLMTSASAEGVIEPPCAACAGPPEVFLTVSLYRHATSLVAIAQEGPGGGVFAMEVDGTPVAPPPGVVRLGYDIPPDHDVWLAESVSGSNFVPGLVLVSSPAMHNVHWDDGTWRSLAIGPVATWQHAQDQLGVAVEALARFDVLRWQRDAAYRAEVHQALTILDRDPASLARAQAAASAQAAAAPSAK